MKNFYSCKYHITYIKGVTSIDTTYIELRILYVFLHPEIPICRLNARTVNNIVRIQNIEHEKITLNIHKIKDFNKIETYIKILIDI